MSKLKTPVFYTQKKYVGLLFKMLPNVEFKNFKISFYESTLKRQISERLKKAASNQQAPQHVRPSLLANMTIDFLRRTIWYFTCVSILCDQMMVKKIVFTMIHHPNVSKITFRNFYVIWKVRRWTARHGFLFLFLDFGLHPYVSGKNDKLSSTESKLQIPVSEEFLSSLWPFLVSVSSYDPVSQVNALWDCAQAPTRMCEVKVKL